MTLLGPWKLGQTHLVCKFCWQNSYAKLENAECDYKSQLRNIYWELSPAVFSFLRDRWHTDARLQITYCLWATGTGFSFVCFALWFLCFVGFFFFFPNLFFSLTNFLGLFQALLHFFLLCNCNVLSQAKFSCLQQWNCIRPSVWMCHIRHCQISAEADSVKIWVWELPILIVNNFR